MNVPDLAANSAKGRETDLFVDFAGFAARPGGV